MAVSFSEGKQTSESYWLLAGKKQHSGNNSHRHGMWFQKKKRRHQWSILYCDIIVAPEKFKACLGLQLMSHSANGSWDKSLNFIFPIKRVIPESLKFSHWLSEMWVQLKVWHEKLTGVFPTIWVCFLETRATIQRLGGMCDILQILPTKVSLPQNCSPKRSGISMSPAAGLKFKHSMTLPKTSRTWRIDGTGRRSENLFKMRPNVPSCKLT